MRKIRTFFYHIGQGFVGVVRNGVISVASLLVLVTCMLLIGTFFLLIDNIDKGFRGIKDINKIVVELSDELQSEEVDAIMGKLAEIKDELGTIENYTFYSSEENYLKFLETEPEDSFFRRNYTPENNPLPRRIEVEFINLSDQDFTIEKVYTLKSAIESIEGISNGDIIENIKLYEDVSVIKSTVFIIGGWIMAVFAAVSIFVILNTIRLGVFARRYEIIFMRYVGATNHFIKMPFTVEGVIIGLFSAGIAFALQYYVYVYILTDIVSTDSSAISAGFFAPFEDYAVTILAIFLAVGLVVGIIAGRMSIRKYLKA